MQRRTVAILVGLGVVATTIYVGAVVAPLDEDRNDGPVVELPK
jgi:hypothetical protein